MQGRPPILDTEEEVIHWYINLYYKRVSEKPEVRLDLDAHIKLIEGVNKEYVKYLGKKEAFDFDKYESAFTDCIEFLTKVFTKKREVTDRQERAKALTGRK